MRIAIFTDTFYPQTNGIVVSTLNLIKGLADKGHKVYVITCSKPFFVKEFTYKNIVIKRLGGLPALFYPEYKMSVPFSKKILGFLLKEKIEIIHFQTPFLIGLNAILMAKLLEVPIIGTFHTFLNRREYRKHLLSHHPILDEVSWKYMRSYYKTCNLVTVPTKTAKNEIFKNKLNKHIRVISNGIEIPKRIRKNTGKPNLLFVGRIAYEKNIFYLIDCFKLIVDKIPNSKLTIVGDGPQMKELKKRIKLLNLEKNIVLKGSIEHNTLMKSNIYSNNKIFVTASLTETQGLTLLEAQARGLVGVGINAPGTRDLIRDGYNGFLAKEGDKIDFAEKIIKLISNKSLYLKMRKNNFKMLKQHNIREIIKTWISVYNLYIKKNNGRKNILHSTGL